MAPGAGPIEVEDTLTKQMLDAQVRHKDAKERASQCAADLRRLVVDAIDAGMTQLRVAKLLGVSRSRIHAILYTELSRL